MVAAAAPSPNSLHVPEGPALIEVLMDAASTPRIYTVKEERGMMPVAVTQEGSLEHSPLGDLYFQHAPEASG